MELNYLEKFSTYYNKNTTTILTHHHNQAKRFHLNCSFTRKKICHCRNYSLKEDKDIFSDFLISLVKGEATINTTGDRISIDFNKEDNDHEFIKEQMKNTNYYRTKEHLRNYEQTKLSIGDFKEIERNINEDKKICEKCGTNLYGDNYHKGWRNENGEHVLLCFSCSKKYFSGASELKFDMKRDEMIPVNRERISNLPQFLPVQSQVFKIDTSGSNPPSVPHSKRYR